MPPRLNPVINAAGKMTALGGSAKYAEVAAAQAEAATLHVELATLRRTAGEYVAALCGADAASLCSGAAAGIAIAVAACISGREPARIRRLPDSSGWPNRVVLQAGHHIDFGAPVEQMVRLGGGQPVIAGCTNRVTDDDIAALLDADCAALLYVQSHHCVQDNQVPLPRCIELARRHAVPVIVDAAAESDLTRYVAAGADLVIYSGGKAIGGPTSGFVVGRADLVEACELQQHGIARSMKIGKEAIAGLLAALSRYGAHDTGAAANAISACLAERLQAIDGLDVSLRDDEAGRPIQRVALRCEDARALVDWLRTWTPPIHTRNHHLDSQLVQFDPRELRAEHVDIIVTAVAAWRARGS